MSKLMQELGEAFPGLKTVLIDERDAYLAERITQASGPADRGGGGSWARGGNAPGAGRGAPTSISRRSIRFRRSRRRGSGWDGASPRVILGSLVLIGLRQGASAAGENLLFWILANGIPSAPRRHGRPRPPRRPSRRLPRRADHQPDAGDRCRLRDRLRAGLPAATAGQRVQGGDQGRSDSLAGWWRNRLLRIFLVFLLTTFGSILGTWVGGAEIVSNLF